MIIDPKKVDAIRQIFTLQCKRELESFQGMVNYLKCYLSPLTQFAETLKELLRNYTLWCWETKNQKAFEAIKDYLTKTLVLAYADPNADHIIQVDGPIKGLVIVMFQKGMPVIYASRTLTPADTGHSNIERSSLV